MIRSSRAIKMNENSNSMKKIVNKSKSNEAVFCWELAAKHLLYASSELKEIGMKHYLLRAASMMYI